MKKSSKILILFFCATISFSCKMTKKPDVEEPQVLDYLQKGTKMDVKKFFNGDIEGFSITQNSEGKIINAQNIKMNGKWEDNKGVLEQRFVDVDGKKENRTWLITINDDGTLTGVAHDISAAASGIQTGNSMRMGYNLSLNDLSVKGSVKQDVKFEDRVYLVDEKSAIMISNFTRLGSSGKTIIALKKPSDPSK